MRTSGAAEYARRLDFTFIRDRIAAGGLQWVGPDRVARDQLSAYSFYNFLVRDYRANHARGAPSTRRLIWRRPGSPEIAAISPSPRPIVIAGAVRPALRASAATSACKSCRVMVSNAQYCTAAARSLVRGVPVDAGYFVFFLGGGVIGTTFVGTGGRFGVLLGVCEPRFSPDGRRGGGVLLG